MTSLSRLRVRFVLSFVLMTTVLLPSPRTGHTPVWPLSHSLITSVFFAILFTSHIVLYPNVNLEPLDEVATAVTGEDTEVMCGDRGR